MVSAVLTSRERPTRTPASLRPSMIWKMYIGPLPLNPVTASSWYSGSSTTVPIDSKIRRASAACAGFAWRPRQRTVALDRTTAATLGMARMTGNGRVEDRLDLLGREARRDRDRGAGSFAGRAGSRPGRTPGSAA